MLSPTCLRLKVNGHPLALCPIPKFRKIYIARYKKGSVYVPFSLGRVWNGYWVVGVN